MAQNALVAAPEHRPLSKDQITAQKNLLKQVQEAVMKKDVHYGVIPGTKKPTLYKAGAEAILTTFHIAAMPEVEDLSTPDCCRYRVSVRGVLPSGQVVGLGIGECSTDEEKYRWRRAVCDEEFEITPEDRRRIKFSTYQGKVNKTKQVRTEPADMANTALKMAKKRALIDLCLTATAASDVFEQDLEDLPAEYLSEHVAAQPQGSAAKPAVAQPKAAPAGNGDGRMIPEGMLKTLRAKIAAAKLSEDAVCNHFQVANLELLPFAKGNEAIKAVAAGQIGAAPAAPAAAPADDEIPPPTDDDLGRPFTEAAHG